MKQKVILGVLLVVLLIALVINFGGGGAKKPATTDDKAKTDKAKKPTVRVPKKGEQVVEVMDEGAKTSLRTIAEQSKVGPVEQAEIFNSTIKRALSPEKEDPFRNRAPISKGLSGADTTAQRTLTTRYKLKGIGKSSQTGEKLAYLNDDEPRSQNSTLDDTGFWIEEIGEDYVNCVNDSGTTVTIRFEISGRRGGGQ